jgi:EF-hand domain pair
MRYQTKIIATLAMATFSGMPFVVRAAGPQQNAAPANTAAQSSGVLLPPPQYIAAGENNAKQLLLLMDTDKNGKVSKAEFMAYMEAEFDRLDVNHDGQLDVKELTAPKVRSVAGGHK